MPQEGINPKLKGVVFRSFASFEVVDLAPCLEDREQIGNAPPSDVLHTEAHLSVGPRG
jgi:hypothetical protein